MDKPHKGIIYNWGFDATTRRISGHVKLHTNKNIWKGWRAQIININVKEKLVETLCGFYTLA